MNKALTLLKSKGLRATVARLQLLSILEETGRARMTAENIFMRVSSEGGSLSLASVYRVLKELSISGLVDRGWYKEGQEIRLLFSLGRVGSERARPEIVCVMCNRSMDIQLPDLRPELNRLAEEMSLQPDDRPIVIQVTCPNCAGK
ncbi:transcriptional repressor [Herbaspirillum sp. WKF16]|uniref:Fur family transcriptional regulator n=1 Tax=Herbaspirillum sp. WKF16 TaxID=3028312 RepID=UPI0023A960FE|nr:transcriptional repressor [Herbaspirillum sp. WKF16]WDZ95805.1 transcriptional repressor [Herbaspirillum sp. WKF16]